MTTGLLLLAHGVVGVLALGTTFVRGPWRSRILMALCVVGAGFGVALVVLSGSLEQWRGLQLRGIATVAGFAITAAWLVAAVISAPAGRAVSCGLVGVAASGMALAVMSEWVVPTLLFWLCSSLAIAALASQVRSGPWVWILLFASDVALVAALLGSWSETRSWTLPDALDGWPFYVLVLGAVLRAGVVPLSGAWSLLGRSSPVIPLLVGGAFCILRVAFGEGDPWVGVVLFLAGLGIALAVIIGRRPWGGIAAAAAASIAVMLGLAAIAPASLSAAGSAAVVAGATAALWFASTDEGAPERVVALVALPPTLGFVAAAVGVVVALARTVVSEDYVDTVPWTIALVAAPLALTANVAVAARLAGSIPSGAGWAKRLRSADRGALGVLAVRLLLAFSVGATIAPGDWLGIETGLPGADARRAILLGVALVLGGVVAWLVVRRAARSPAVAPPPTAAFRASAWLDAPPAGTLAGRLLTGTALLFAVGAIAAVGWLAFEGLRLGFL